MLDTLDQIGWHRLSHAYGQATNVPQLLRLLMDLSPKIREQAAFDLCGSIHHQGSIYEATAYVVPFLVEMAREKSVPDRALILGILGGISEEWLKEDREFHEDLSAWPLSYRPTAQRIIAERPYRMAAHRAIEDHFDEISGLLLDSEVSVRVAAAFVVATMMDHAERAASSLRQVIDQDPEDWCRAASILALAELARQTTFAPIIEVARERYHEILLSDDFGPDARLCAGVALLHLGDTTLLPQTLEQVRPRLTREMKHFYQFPSTRYSRNLFGLMADALVDLPENRVTWICEGVEHFEYEVKASALCEAGKLCREVRWGPSRFVPLIVKLVDDPDPRTRMSAISYLRDAGRAGAQQLSLLLRHPIPDVRTAAAEELKSIASHAARRLTQWTETRPPVVASVESLISIVERHQGSANWRDVEEVRKAVAQLGFHGPNASRAIDLVHRQIDRTTNEIFYYAGSELRVTAIRAVWQITREADFVVQRLLESLEPGPFGFLVIEQLREIGSPARSALPALRKILDTDHRFTHVGDCSGCVPDDEAYQEYIINAIFEIEQNPNSTSDISGVTHG